MGKDSISCLTIRKKSDEDEMTMESQRRKMCSVQETLRRFLGLRPPHTVLALLVDVCAFTLLGRQLSLCVRNLTTLSRASVDVLEITGAVKKSLQIRTSRPRAQAGKPL